ncbi:hypothetical protein QR680_005587 [Steinernema hermaphroditum]|uniref:Protein kinase domain-containing protein n=1 Tax=Steinernema hermaphroditum TaxID=289476 RepID=A0AA39HU00_9BILA|nr:hypothetical protein QR680_005587 [Steinernema hermaphroditum]
MEPLTIDCSGGFSTSFYGNPIGSFEPSSMNPSTSLGLSTDDYPTVDPEDVVIYRFQELGRGAYGSVVRGTYRGRPCAIKLKRESDAFSVMKHEAKNLHMLRHEGVINFFGVMLGVPQGIVMELMEGGSMHEFLHAKKHFQYSTQSVIWWSLQCCRALEHIHRLGFVHRDIKPLNLLLDNFYQTLKICDFGTTAPQKTSMTNNQGTSCWMAPEVFKGKKYDAKADVFSYGITLWEMVTRRFPYEELGSSGEFAIQWQKVSGARPPMVAGCIKPLADLMTLCWAEEASDRPDISDVVRILEVLTEIYPVPSAPPFDRSTLKPAQAREYYHMELAASLNQSFLGDAGRPKGPKIVDKEDLSTLETGTNTVVYVGQNAISRETPHYFSQSSHPEYSISNITIDESLRPFDCTDTSPRTELGRLYSPMQFSRPRLSVDSQTSSKEGTETENPKKKKSLPGKSSNPIKKFMKSRKSS